METYRSNLMVCSGTGCVSNGSFLMKEALNKEILKHGLENEIKVITTGCNGFCANGPVVVVHPERIFYHMITEEKVPHLVQEHFLKGRPVPDFMFTPPEEVSPIPRLDDIPFFKHQRLIALRNRGLIDPENIDEYISRDGYAALAKALTEMTPKKVIKEVKESGLRGRGGAGFPTGLKWELTSEAEDEVKYIVCNADEGDPGAFMDRSILESDPHSVIEGMTIGAWAIGAHQGFIYIRNEYPLAYKRLLIAIEQAREYGLLGENILDMGFKFDIQVHRGAGAFVCGEETALLAALEGKRSEPRSRPPYPVQKGFDNKPTNINNVETWANIPPIVLKGAKWFSEIGTEKSKGTKVFSLVGKINNTGLIEVPMGVTLGEIIYKMGGGAPDGKKIKAVQTGGPSGGCIPAELFNMPINYESLTEAGSMMGSGGMVVMDEDTCMVDIAKYFLTFTQSESCGKCTPCRDGTKRMLDILTKITDGKGTAEDLQLLEELAYFIKNTSSCGLGKTASNPVISTLRYFRDEYAQHIKYKKCPAMICRDIIFTPCKYNCPVDTEIPAFVAQITKNQYSNAFETIRKNNPFPITTSFICHHPCEDRCQSGVTQEPITIKGLKRFVSETALNNGFASPKPVKPKYSEKVAVIGAGPAGLTAAYDLTKSGYEVTVFDSSQTAGGMLSAAIPKFRMPQNILDFELKNITQLGVKIKSGMTIGNDLTITDLLQQGYKAIFIAVGAHKSLKLGIKGENKEGVIDSLEFLKDVKSGKKVNLGEKVAVIGGGNCAIDAARTAWRLGSKVFLIYRRTVDEMPAIKKEVQEGFKEGIKFIFLSAPVKIVSQNGKITGLTCIKMKLGDYDESGRRRPVPIEGSEFDIEIDNLIPAIGEEPNLSDLMNGITLKTSKRNTILVDPETLATDIPGIFAGGDCVTGPSTIADSIAQGKLAAASILKFLRGESLKREYKVTEPSEYIEPLVLSDEEIEELSELARPVMPTIPVEKRAGNFNVVELGLSEEVSIKEAKRCLRCDAR
ncbi:hydrogenase [bacterium SM23_31]|nr:MAG: hydrogenase [bacterium SM23_31]